MQICNIHWNRQNRTNSVIPAAKTVTYIRIANGSPKLTKLVWKTDAYQLNQNRPQI